MTQDALGPKALARLTGVSTDTLRHYERKGVLPKALRMRNGYRRYPASAVARVRLVRRALTLGFTLDELAEVLTLRDGGGVPCRRVVSLAERKLDETIERIQELQVLRGELEEIVARWRERLQKTPLGKRSYLLEEVSRHESRLDRRDGKRSLPALDGPASRSLRRARKP